MNYSKMSKTELVKTVEKLHGELEECLETNTKRSEVEDALKRSEEKFRSLVENTPNTILIVDREGRVEFINRTVPGFRPEDIIGTSIFDYIGPEYHARAKGAIEEAFSSCATCTFENTMTAGSEGGTLWCLTSVGPVKHRDKAVAVTLVTADITALKQAQEELGLSRERFRAVFDHVTDGILLADAENHQLFMANRAICNMLGYTEQEIRKLTVSNIHPEEDLKSVMDKFEKQLRGVNSLARSIPVKKKDGSVFYADVNSAPVRLHDREYLIGIFRDITEHNKAEEAARELEAQKLVIEKLQELDRMKDEFVSTVTHELRTPMTPLRSTIEMLLDGSLGEISPRQRKFVGMMARNVERLTQFTTEVLTLSRLESGRYKLTPKLLPIMEVVEPVMDLMKARADGRKSTVTLDIAKLTAYADPDSLGMVVTNLTNNAIVHTPEGTAITVSARQARDDFVEIAISDNGEGISEEHLDNLFDRFYQAKRRESASYKGTGVGLAVCKALVEAMGGNISVESQCGKGTTFRFTVPAKQI